MPRTYYQFENYCTDIKENKRRISPPNSMPILGDEVVAEVGEG
jgi:hypothetical protein